MEDYNIDKILKDQFNPIKEVQISIQKNYPLSNKENTPNFKSPDLGQSSLMGGVGMQEIQQKPSFTREVAATEAYDLVGGEWMKKFPTYKQGRDNIEYAAQNQTASEQVMNGLSKAGLNIGSVILGNTAVFVYGLGSLASSGNFSSIYDNSFAKTLDDWNTKLNYQLPNYYTKQEKEAGFFGSLAENPANFIANDIMNGLSFTVGTIASEAIWAYATGGVSLAARAGQLGAKLGNIGRFGKTLIGVEKAAEGLAKYKGFVYKALDNAVTAGSLSKNTANVLAKTGEVLNTARFIATSSGNEAGIEAFHYKKEAMENFYNNFEQLNNRHPTAEEVADISSKIEGSANKVFATNMAILGVSNLAMIGGMFNVKSPISGIQSSINKKLFGIGVEKAIGEEVFKAVERKAWQKSAGLLYKVVSPIVREGLFEEGLQGATTKTANNWIERQYDPKYLNGVMTIGDDAWKAMGEQYGTKAGWKEIGIGGIVGILGGGFTGEFSQFSDMAKEQKEVVAKSLNAMNVTLNTLVSDINASRYSSVAKIMASEDKAEQAKISGDAVAAKLAHNESMVAVLEMHNDPIMNTDFKQLEKHFNNSVDTTEVSQEEKDDIKEGFKTFVKNFKTADNFADSIVGSQGKVYGTTFQAKEIKKALTYSLLQGESAKEIMQSSLEEMGSHINVESLNAIKRNEKLEELGKDKRRQVRNLTKQHKNWETQSKDMQQKVQVLQASPNEVDGNKQSGLVEMQQKLIDIENSKKQIKDELEGITREITQNEKMQSPFNQELNIVDEFISVDDLLNLDEQLKELETTHSTLKTLNPVSARAIEDYMNNYNKAKQALYVHNDAIKLIANGKFQVRIANDNPFSAIFNKFSKGTAKPEEFTGEFLTKLNEIRQGYTTKYTESLQKADIEKNIKIVEELNSLETLTEDQQAQKSQAEKTLEDLSPKTITKEDVKDDTPVKKEAIKETPKTVVEELKAIIEDILKLFKTSFVGTQDVEEALKKKPSNKDIEKYRELKQDKLIQDYELTGQLPTDTTLVEEFKALKEKLSQWRVYDSLAEDNQSVADLLDIVAQLETEVEQQNTVAEPNIEDIFENKEDFIGIGQQKEYSLSVNTNFPATIHINKNNTVDITHQKPLSILERMNAIELTVNRKPLSFDQINNQKLGTIINFNSDGVLRSITIGKSGRIIMSQDDFRAIPNVKFLTSISTWSYPVLHERDKNGEWKPIESDFKDTNIVGDINELEKNEAVELFIDINNEFNQKLLKNKNAEYQIDQVVIYIRKDGVVYGTVKALDRENSNSNIETLRKEAHKNLLAGKSGVIATTTVEYIQVGNPVVSLDESGNISQNEFSDDALKSIIATGYSMNGKLFLSTSTKEEEIRKTLLKKANENSKDKKIPIVVIKRGKQKIAFPISLVKTNVDKTGELYNILNNDSSTDAQKVVGINNVLINNNISPKDFNLVELSEEKIAEIEKKLTANEEFILAEQLADKKYNKENLKKDATIALDLENLFVSLPSQKFNISLDSISYETLPDVKVEKQEVLEKIAKKEVETPDVISAKKQVNNTKTNIKKEVIEESSLIINTEEIAQTIVDKIKEPGGLQENRVNLVSFESIDFSGKPVVYYKKGSKWGYLDANNNFESLVPIAQSKIEQDYQVQKELQQAKKDITC